MPGPDASWWDSQQPEYMPKGVPALQAEVRRLRGELLRVQDELGQAITGKNWTTLLATCKRVRAMAEVALGWRPKA